MNARTALLICLWPLSFFGSAHVRAQDSSAPAAPAEQSPVPELEGEGLRLVEERLYHVSGYDFASLQAVSHICREAERALSAFFPMPESVPLPLLVQLIPSEKLAADTPAYWFDEGAHSNLLLSIRWDGKTQLRQVCEAVATGLLRQALTAAVGSEAGRFVPRWLCAAFGMQTYCNLQAVFMDGLQAESAPVAAIPLADLFTGRAADPKMFANDAFWLLRTLRQASRDRLTVARWLQRFSLEKDPLAVLRECVPEAGETPQSIQLWWELQRQCRLVETPPRVWELAQSREFLAQSVLIPARVKGEDRMLTVPELWPYRETTSAKMAAVDRMRVMRLKTNMINPVYFNAAVSYSEALEALVTGHEGRLREKYAQFTRDIAGAVALENTVNAALDAPLFPAPTPAR